MNKEIKEGGSKFSVKSNSISITLAKKEKNHWDDLKEKASPFKKGLGEMGKDTEKDKDKDKSADPQASLMNMMKEMYESGDDEMKKMIAQSWTKANDEQTKKKA